MFVIIYGKVSFFLSFYSFFLSPPSSPLSRQTLKLAKTKKSCKSLTAASSELDGEIMKKKINASKVNVLKLHCKIYIYICIHFLMAINHTSVLS